MLLGNGQIKADPMRMRSDFSIYKYQECLFNPGRPKGRILAKNLTWPSHSFSRERRRHTIHWDTEPVLESTSCREPARNTMRLAVEWSGHRQAARWR